MVELSALFGYLWSRDCAGNGLVCDTIECNLYMFLLRHDHEPPSGLKIGESAIVLLGISMVSDEITY